jgi:D-alanine-D-alanine ligase
VTARRRVAVLMGGRSSEHAVSLESARSVIDGLDPDRYEVVTLEIGQDGRWALPSGHVPKRLGSALDTSPAEPATPGPETTAPSAPGGTVPGTLPVPASSGEVAATLAEVDVVLPILHGPFGEDGRLQGLLEMAGVPYVGADHAASAVCMDKDLFKAIMRDQGIPVTRNVTLRAGSAAGKAGDPRPEDLGNGAAPENPFGYPVFVKPARLGSSVGISKAHDAEELRAAVELAFRHDEKVLVEEFVSGVEVEVGVLGNREPFASLVGEIVVTHNEWYDYEAKYDEGEMNLVVPARITPDQTARVQHLAVQAFVATECEGMARVDCFVTGDGEVLINELNTIPGFTSTSVYAKLFEASGIPYPELLDRLVELALERYERRSKLSY